MGLGESTSDPLGISLTVAGHYTRILPLRPIPMYPYGVPQESRNQISNSPTLQS